MTNDLRGRRVLVLGGTGFVGARLVERLIVEYGAEVTVLVRDFATAARVARFPVHLAKGDVRDRASVAAAAQGCDVMFHCAFGNWRTAEDQRAITVEGTRAALAGAMDAGVKRTVYVSTLSVYGLSRDGIIDERSPRRLTGSAYGDAKLEAERIAEGFIQRGMKLTIIQPTVIYGPHSKNWTVALLARLRGSGQILIGDGSGYCNAVFVDDLVSSLVLAATVDAAVGQTYLISGPQPVTWAEFIGQYAKMLGGGAIVSVTADEARKGSKVLRRPVRLSGVILDALRRPETISAAVTTPEARLAVRTTRRLLPKAVWQRLKQRYNPDVPHAVAGTARPGKLPYALTEPDIALFSARQTVSIDKARQELGYEPEYALADGMAVTERWARWQGLIP